MKKIPLNSPIRPGSNKKAKVFQQHDTDPCLGCASCCQYVAVEIDTPTVFNDFQNIYWYLVHHNVWVYADHDNAWHIQFNTSCDMLVADRCSVYEHRPEMCRAYQPEQCTRYHSDAAEKILLKSKDDLWEYLKYQRPALYTRFASYRTH